MSEVPDWADPPPIALLDEGEVHVWRAFRDDAAPLLAQLAQTLSSDERGKAESFPFFRERNRFVVARGVLRAILSRYLSVAAADIRFTYGEAGKPELATTSHSGQIRFSVSHCGALAVYGIVRERQIGVDIERVRPFRDVERVAERFFAASEWAALRRLPPELRDEGFFNCWTRKEAFLKAIGVGITHLLSSFAVTLRPGDPAAFLELEPNVARRTQWKLEHLAPAAGHVGALCVEAPVHSVRYYGWCSSSLGHARDRESSAG